MNNWNLNLNIWKSFQRIWAKYCYTMQFDQNYLVLKWLNNFDHETFYAFIFASTFLILREPWDGPSVYVGVLVMVTNACIYNSPLNVSLKRVHSFDFTLDSSIKSSIPHRLANFCWVFWFLCRESNFFDHFETNLIEFNDFLLASLKSHVENKVTDHQNLC